MRLQHAVQVFIEGSWGVVSTPVMILSVRVGEEVSAQHRVIWRSRPLGDSFSFVHGAEVFRQCCELSLKTIPFQYCFTKSIQGDNKQRPWLVDRQDLDTDPSFLKWYLQTYLHVHFRMRVHVVKQLLVVDVLLVPLQRFIVPEIVSQRNQQHFAAEQLGLLTILVEQNRSSETQNP